ncbi:branched-chain amino acid ABC transporter permease [candidate division KSB1 bacterium]|nr:MAG: branched-chain amino acid ABC transporter permease [candidate division KSB1 bacterium]MBC6949718.1 branched-chain amino acid ABC transporter permease [candidate division KSB1 bacterium]MCE7944522.1 branched-chain amino acid ABC transporter permease [Chlorobi bacterium CHB1]
MISQILANGLIAGSVYALVALGFSVIYSTVRFFHFAHGVVYTAGAYFTFLYFILFKLPFAVAVALAILSAALLGVAIEFLVYKPIKRQRASGTILLIASLGVSIILQNLISLFFGDDTKTIRTGEVREGLNVLGARITPVQIAIILTSLVLFAFTFIILKRSKIGKALRAVANDPELAVAMGLNKDRIIYFTYFVGSALAAIAAILISLDIDMTPLMGFQAMLYGVVAVVIGGLGNILGAYLGGLLLGLAQHLGVWYISSQWQDAIAFVILILFLLFRPQGFFGKKIRKAEV